MEGFVHALNRGVDKRQIFMDDHDRMRFVYGLILFNDVASVDMAALKKKGLTMSFLEASASKRRRFVDVHAWCLMGNHYHLLLSERVENGSSSFLKKLNIGYVKYFNDRHQRSGTLYQGRTKQIIIEKDAHFLHIFNYIHLNPLDFSREYMEWRAGSIKKADAASQYLKKYRWSSFNDYCAHKNFPAVISPDFFGSMHTSYDREIARYLRDMETDDIGEYALE